MRKWDDLYNLGNDYPQFVDRRREPIKTDVDILFGKNKLSIRFVETNVSEIEKVEAELTEKE